VSPEAPRLSVVIPTYQEATVIGSTLDSLRRALTPAAPVELVVADDHSTDGTPDVARHAGADRVVVLDQHRGKGAAVRAGVMTAAGATVAFIDADLAYSPDQLLRLLEKVESGCDVVVGSRRHVDAVTLVRARRLREVTGRVFNEATRLLVLGEPRDTQCGLKAFSAAASRQIFERSRVDGFAFDVEIFLLAERLGLAVAEVPVELANTTASSVRVGRDAARMVRDLLRMRWWATTGGYPQAPGGGVAPGVGPRGGRQAGR